MQNLYRLLFCGLTLGKIQKIKDHTSGIENTSQQFLKIDFEF